MATISRLLAAPVFLAAAAAAAAAAQPLEPEWSRPVGGRSRLVGVEEYGRCSVFVDRGAIHVVAPSGQTEWTWPFAKVSRYITPRDVAISHDCGAIALVGNASYKHAWIVQRSGKSASLEFAATPADVEFDRTGARVAIGTYAGSIYLYSTSGELLWRRDTRTVVVQDLEFTDDNTRILFKGWGGNGVVSTAGHVEWQRTGNRMAAARDLATFVFSEQPNHGPGLPDITVTDHRRTALWRRWASIEAFLSATGHRVLATVDRVQDKKDDDFFGVKQMGDVHLLSRDGGVIAAYPDYDWPVAFSDDGTRMWLRAAHRLACVGEDGAVLAEIAVSDAYRNDVHVSRDFGQVLIVRQAHGKPARVERYAVASPCR